MKNKFNSGYGPKLVEIDLNQDGRISFVEASLIGLQIHLRQAEIDNTPCIKCKSIFLTVEIVIIFNKFAMIQKYFHLRANYFSAFAGADVDGSGAISEEEFSQWFEVVMSNIYIL